MPGIPNQEESPDLVQSDFPSITPIISHWKQNESNKQAVILFQAPKYPKITELPYMFETTPKGKKLFS